MANNNIITKVNLADIRMIDLNVNEQIIFEEIGIVYLDNITLTQHKRYVGGKMQQVVGAICGDNANDIKKWAFSHKPQIFN